MQTHAKIALGLVFAGSLTIGGYRVLQPWLNAQLQKSTSDSAHIEGKLRIGMDGWVGYFPLCSPEMSKRVRASGLLLECVDDNAAYPARFQQLADGSLDFAVATVDSLVLNGARQGYPGPVVAVLDESKGGDALVAWRDALPELDALKTNAATIAYTPASPSHHLLKAMASHFDLPTLLNPANAQLTEGSAAALQALRAKTVQAAVLWEPDLSRALAEPGVIKLMSTADTQGLIVDVLLAGREVLRKQPERVELLLHHYFQTLQFYRNNPEVWRDAIASHYRISAAQAETLMQGVDWASLSDNARSWFGLEPSQNGAQGLVESLEATVDILLEAGDFTENPIPARDPHRLLNSAPLANVWQRASFAQRGDDAGAQVTFTPLSGAAWARLAPVATLKVRPIVFASGSDELTDAGREQLDKLGRDLKHYPRFRVEVRGHTGTRGDEAENQALSEARARTVLQYLQQHQSVAAERARALGFGGSRPLAQLPGENSRAYHYRLPRVELVLLEDEI